jgi:UDP:flavonoid glycosyltransferase YjiC (YdhE family)
LLALAVELNGRGHKTTFINQPDAAAFVRGRGVGFVPIGASFYPPGSLEKRIQSMGRLKGPVGLRSMIAEVARFTDVICREAPTALREIGADAVISDQMEAGGGLSAEHLGLPFASIATALPINREDGVPPPYVPWPYDPSQRGLWWNRGGYRISDFLMRPVAQVIERHSNAFGLGRRRRAEDCFSPIAQLAQCVPGIDFPRAELPDSFRYLGPFREENEGSFDLADGGRPLVFCSLGTLQGSRAGLFRNVAAACASLDLRLLIAHGGRLAPEAAAKLPGNPIVADYVPQRAVLRRAALAITHAGFNTVLDSLSYGVPMVAIPLAFEQPATAARLERAGVARIVTPAKASPRRIAEAIGEVLGERHYRENAALIQAQIAKAGGVRLAADILEARLS